MSQTVKFEYLRSLVVAVQFGSFGQAAQILGITQPALSQRIQELEKDFGTLLERDTKGVRATDAGKILVEHALKAMQSLDEAETRVASLRAGTAPTEVLTIGYSPSHVRLVTAALEAVVRKRPNLRVITEEADAADVEEQVAGGKLQVGVAYISRRKPGVEAEEVRETALHVLVRRTHRFAELEAVNVKELVNEPLALPKEPMRIRDTIDAYLRREKIDPKRVVLESNAVATLLWAVNAGLGVTILPGIRLIADEALVRRKLHPAPPKQMTSLLWNKKQPRCEAAKAFAQEVHDCVGRMDT